MAAQGSGGRSGLELCCVQQEALTPEQQAAVAEISETVTQNGGTVRIKLHDKIGALEKIGKHLGMYRDIVEVRRIRWPALRHTALNRQALD